jgi:hypothetical protein
LFLNYICVAIPAVQRLSLTKIFHSSRDFCHIQYSALSPAIMRGITDPGRGRKFKWDLRNKHFSNVTFRIVPKHLLYMYRYNLYAPVTVCPTRGLLPLPFLIISFEKPIIELVDDKNLRWIVEATTVEDIIRICLFTFLFVVIETVRKLVLINR